MNEPETKWISQQGTLAVLKGFSSAGGGLFPEFRAEAFVFSGQIVEFPNSPCCAGNHGPLVLGLLKITTEFMAEVARAGPSSSGSGDTVSRRITENLGSLSSQNPLAALIQTTPSGTLSFQYTCKKLAASLTIPWHHIVLKTSPLLSPLWQV